MTDTGGEALRRYLEARAQLQFIGDTLATVREGRVPKLSVLETTQMRKVIEAADELALRASRGDAPSDFPRMTACVEVALNAWETRSGYYLDRTTPEVEGFELMSDFIARQILAALSADALTPKDAPHD